MLRVTTSFLFSTSSKKAKSAAPLIGLDIGGSFAKCAFFDSSSSSSSSSSGNFRKSLPSSIKIEEADSSLQEAFSENNNSNNNNRDNGDEDKKKLFFAKVPTRNVDTLFSGLADALSSTSSSSCSSSSNPVFKIPATGGGAKKFSEHALKKFNLQLEAHGEMEALSQGTGLLKQKLGSDAFFAYDNEKQRVVAAPDELDNNDDHSSFLLCNIGSGTSFLKVETVQRKGEEEGEEKITTFKQERVGGSSIGGATLFGLTRMITTNIKSFDEISHLFAKNGPGNNGNVDYLVRDIFGGMLHEGEKLESIQLPPPLTLDTIASSLGKIGSSSEINREIVLDNNKNNLKNQQKAESKMNEENTVETSSSSSADSVVEIHSVDVIRSLLLMLCYNFTQLAFLYAQISGVSSNNIIFSGGFVQSGNEIVHSAITECMSFWSIGKERAVFLKQSDFVGSLGALELSSSCSSSSS